MKQFWLIILLLTAIRTSHSADYGKVEVKKVADGIYLFRTSPHGDVGMSANSVAILTEDGVVVFDSTAIPQTAATIFSEIQKLSNKPVPYLVNSHWH